MKNAHKLNKTVKIYSYATKTLHNNHKPQQCCGA